MSASPFDRLTFLSKTGRKAVEHLARELVRCNLVLFAGAGLSRNAPSKGAVEHRMPSWQELGEILLADLDASFKDQPDVLKIADYYESALGRTALVGAVRKAIGDEQHDPGRVHRSLARLNFEEIITTNYDTLIERAFRELYLSPQVVVKGEDLTGRRSTPRIIKMNGSFDRDVNDIVITGDDFLGYSERNPLIEAFVTKSFVESQVLFVGFGLNDPAFRAINERIARTLSDNCPRSFALMMGVSPTEIGYWRKRHVEVIDLQAAEPDLADEERIYRLFHAMFEYQHSFLQPAKPPDAATPEQLFGSSATPAPHALELFSSIVPKLTDIAAAVTEPVRRLLGACLADAGHSHAGPARVEKAICRVLRLATGIDGGSLYVKRNPEWKALSDLVTLLVNGRRDAIERASEADLAIVITHYALYDSALGQAPGSKADRESRVEEQQKLERRLLHAARWLGPECLRAHDAAVRARFWVLALLFAPLDDLAKVTKLWAGGNSERGLLEGSGVPASGRIEETPPEYRIQILNFFGLLNEQPSLYEVAVDSLWSRQLAAMTDTPAAAAVYNAATRRYRFLMHVEQAKKSPAMEVHERRMRSLLGSDALHQDGVPTHQETVGAYLIRLLSDYFDGWLCGSQSPMRFLKRSWEAARLATDKSQAETVPWGVLLAISLPAETEQSVVRYDVLTDAWHQGVIDTETLLQHVATRIGNARFTRYSTEENRAVAKYELALARLLAWITARLDEEADTAPKQRCVTIVGQAVKTWLVSTRFVPVRSLLLESLTRFTRWDPETAAPIVSAWAQSQLTGSRPSALGLAELVPDSSTMPLQPDQVRLLLAHVQSESARGGDFQTDVETWLVQRSDALDARTKSELAVVLVEWMEEETLTFEWIARAARIRVKPALTAEVAALPPVNKHAGLGRYVMHRLRSLEGKAAEAWCWKREAFLADLAAFVDDLDAGDRQFLMDSVVTPDALTPDGRDRAAVLASTMMRHDPHNAGDSGRWLNILTAVIEKGATGSGRLGPALGLLASKHKHNLEDNLLTTLGRRLGTNNAESVDWIGRTILEAPAGMTFPDLENELCSLLVSRERPFAIAAARVLVQLAHHDADVLSRNAARIRRTYVVMNSADREHCFRTSSSFRRHLASLHADMEALRLQGSSMLSPPPPPPPQKSKRPRDRRAAP